MPVDSFFIYMTDK